MLRKDSGLKGPVDDAYLAECRAAAERTAERIGKLLEAGTLAYPGPPLMWEEIGAPAGGAQSPAGRVCGELRLARRATPMGGSGDDARVNGLS